MQYTFAYWLFLSVSSLAVWWALLGDDAGSSAMFLLALSAGTVWALTFLLGIFNMAGYIGEDGEFVTGLVCSLGTVAAILLIASWFGVVVLPAWMTALCWPVALIVLVLVIATAGQKR